MLICRLFNFYFSKSRSNLINLNNQQKNILSYYTQET